MPGVSDFLKAVEAIALFNAVIFFAGRAMLRSMKRKGFHRRAFHGWFVWVWMMGGVVVGGCFMPWTAKAYFNFGPLMLGMGTGWLGGTIHGLVALRRMPSGEPDGNDERPSS